MTNKEYGVKQYEKRKKKKSSKDEYELYLNLIYIGKWKNFIPMTFLDVRTKVQKFQPNFT